MKMQPVKVIEVENEGLISLIGSEVFLMCFNYFYAGTLIGVNDTVVKLENCHVVYETGAFGDSKFKDAQKIASEFYIQLSAIESFGKTNKLN